MKIINEEVLDNEKYYTKTYTFDNNIQIDSFIKIVKNFENNETKMSACYCDSFNEYDKPSHIVFYKAEDIEKMKNNPSPYIDFFANFCDRNTEEYKFDISTSTNSNVLEYVINKKKIKNESESHNHKR